MERIGFHMRWDTIKNRFHTDTGSQRLFQLCFDGVILMVVGIFSANYPAGLPEWRFFGTEFALIALLILNILWANPRPAASQRLGDLQTWSFLILSAFLIFIAIWISGQFDLVYLLSLICIQADFKLGVWPGGAVFSIAILGAWLALQIYVGSPLTEIVGRESSLAVGIVFGLLVVTLLKRSARQTKLAQDLLKELQAANRELESAQQKEKDLAVAEERVRLARELHDSVTQSLYSVSLYAEAAAELIGSGEMETAVEHLHAMRDTAQEALREMRLLIFELRRPALEKSGLAAALQARLDLVEARGGISTKLIVEGTEQTPPAVQIELYNMIREALNNALKHAHAKNVQVRLRFGENSTLVEVCDDGIGFEPGGDQSWSGFGLPGMRERAQKIGGTLQIDSAPYKGTRITVEVPMHPSTHLEEAVTIGVHVERE